MKYLIEQISFEDSNSYLDVEWNIEGYVTLKSDEKTIMNFDEDEFDMFYKKVKELFKQDKPKAK